jgi:hypothetical protein
LLQIAERRFVTVPDAPQQIRERSLRGGHHWRSSVAPEFGSEGAVIKSER